MKTPLNAIISASASSFAAALAIVALAGCESSQSANQNGTPIESVNARVMTARAQPVRDYFEATGTVVSRDKMQISSKLMGRIISVSAHEGMRVAAGQQLVQIDDSDTTARQKTLIAELEESRHDMEEAEREVKAAKFAKAAADADLLLATQNYRRYDELSRLDAVSRQDFDNASARYQAAVAHVDQAEENIRARLARLARAAAHIERAKSAIQEANVQLAFTKIAAPAAGVVCAKHAYEGDMAVPGVPLLTVEAEKYRLEVPVDESRMGLLKHGATVPVKIEGAGGREFSTTIDEIVPAADPATRSFTVKLALPSGAGISSGMFGRARFSAGERSAVLLPAGSIFDRGQLPMVYIVDPQKTARLRLVKTGKTYGAGTEIISGLSSGEKVIVSDLGRIADGVRVNL